MSAQDISFLPDGYLERKARHRSNIVAISLFCGNVTCQAATPP